MTPLSCLFYVHLFFPDAAHYDTLANNYDYTYRFQHTANVNLIKHYIPLTKDDQIVDIGGGTGEVLYRLRKELGIERPGVCVEPNERMLQIAAKKEGIIPILSTAEDFLAKKPDYSMKAVFLNGCAHHIKDLSKTIGNLAEFMLPVNGTCIITQYPFPREVWFEAAVKKFSGLESEHIQAIADRHGLQCTPFEWKEPVQMDKEAWYECLRLRYVSTLSYFSDEEIEKGIHEIALKFINEEMLKFDIFVQGWILKPKN